MTQKDKKQEKLDKRAAALKANMMRRKEFQKELKERKKDKDEE